MSDLQIYFANELTAPCSTDSVYLKEDVDERIAALESQLAAEQQRVKVLRRRIDNIKVRSYELGQKELHDMALATLQATAQEEP